MGKIMGRDTLRQSDENCTSLNFSTHATNNISFEILDYLVNVTVPQKKSQSISDLTEYPVSAYTVTKGNE